MFLKYLVSNSSKHSFNFLFISIINKEIALALYKYRLHLKYTLSRFFERAYLCHPIVESYANMPEPRRTWSVSICCQCSSQCACQSCLCLKCDYRNWLSHFLALVYNIGNGTSGSKYLFVDIAYSTNIILKPDFLKHVASGIDLMICLAYCIWFSRPNAHDRNVYLRDFAKRSKRLLQLLRFDFRTQVADEYVVVLWRRNDTKEMYGTFNYGKSIA